LALDNRPPNFELPNNVAVLEKSIDSDVAALGQQSDRPRFQLLAHNRKGVEMD